MFSMGKVFSDNQIQIFEQVAKMPQYNLKAALGKFLRKEYKKVVEAKEYIYAEGDIPVALVAHMDTVFKAPPEDIFYDKQKNVMWSPDGLGADDRAGIFMIMCIIKAGYKPHIVFTTDEEIGGLGASALIKKKNPFKDLRFVIQLDRRGTNDCVFYDCDNPDFVKYIEQFGFVETWGTFSDISYLCPAWGVAGTNLSVGYKDEHSVSETLHVNAWYSTFEKVKNILSEEDFPFFQYIEVDYKKYYKSMGITTGPYGGSKWWDYAYADYPSDEYGYTDDYAHCAYCDTIENTQNMVPVQSRDGTIRFACYDCLRDKVSWCDLCDQPFEIDPHADSIELCCPSCTEKLLSHGIN